MVTTNRVSIFTKFLILASTLSAILAVIFILTSNLYIKNSFINRSKSAIASAVQFKARDLQTEDFSLKDSTRTREVFNDFYEEVKSSEILRIKVWDYSGRVIFSDDSSIVGQRFPENEEFKEAIKGEVITEIGQKVKTENISERGYEQLLEVYVPITFRSESVPSGVIEAYFKLDNVNDRIRETQIILSVMIVTFTLMSFGLLFMVFRLVIYKQIEQMNLQATMLKARTEQLESLTKSQEETKKAMLNVMEDLQVAKATIEFERVKDEAILASIGDGLMATDEKGQVILINQVGCDLLGFKKEELLGKKFIDVVGMVDEKGHIIPEDKRPIQMSTTTTTTTESIYHYVRKDKTQFPVAITVTPITLNNKITGVIEIFRDITQEKEIDKAKTEFVSLASHQLRTPLTSINWYIEMLQSGDAGQLNDKQKNFFFEIYKSSRRMVQLINDLLNISRLETGRLKIEPISTNLGAFIQEICKEAEPLIQGTGCHLSLKLPEKLEKVNVDQILLRQVISNLLINAIQYSSVGKRGQVIISLTTSPKEYTISVKDNGIGIPQELQGRIFEKFFRADNAREIISDGSGLGLYLVKQIMDASGGSIGFSSEPGQETTFHVTIPISGMIFKTGEKGLEE